MGERKSADEHYRAGWLLLIMATEIDAKINLEKAIKEFESAVRQTPNNPAFHEALLYAAVPLATRYSDIFLERKKSLISMALTAQKKAVEFGEDAARLHFFLGIVYSCDIQTHFNDAVREFEKAAEMDSQNALPMYWLASVYAQKQADEAMLATLKAANKRQQYTLYFPSMLVEYALAYPPSMFHVYWRIIPRVQAIATAYTANGESEKAIEVNQTLLDYGRQLIGSQPSSLLGLLCGNASIATASPFLLRLYANQGMEEEAKRVERIKALSRKLAERTKQKIAEWSATDLSRKWDKSSLQEWIELYREGQAREVRFANEIAKEFLAEWEGR